jgi:TRAP-type mannitol/chloroaromatic compound transport system permease small subunit
VKDLLNTIVHHIERGSQLPILLQISRAIDTLNEWIGRLINWLVLGMIAIGVWNVAGRYIGQAIGQNLTSNALIESQWYLFDIVFLLGAAYALKHNAHVRVDVIYNQLLPKQKALINLVGTLLFLIPFCILGIWFSWNTVVQSWQIWEMSPDPGGLPRYPIKTMIIVSFATLLLQGISQGIKNFAIVTGQLPIQEEERSQ